MIDVKKDTILNLILIVSFLQSFLLFVLENKIFVDLAEVKLIFSAKLTVIKTLKKSDAFFLTKRGLATHRKSYFDYKTNGNMVC